ncbi:MAG: helix-turn-helix transcriptional regulator [Clostridiaceae bacterium]|nr:helix-turn-helix transcriptional regulator [Clostridiaceae bacterium]
MKRQYYRLLGLLLYILLLSVLMGFDWAEMVRPIPLISVILGILILTLAQHKSGMGRYEVLTHAQWNSFMAGIIASLLSLLSGFSLDEAKPISIHMLADGVIPLIYGSIIYIVIGLLNPDQVQQSNETDNPMTGSEQLNNTIIPLSDPLKANSILLAKGFTPRECHVAFKLIENISNKEIAEQLYISEATVKKHVQNMFKKCGANDRREFIALYVQWMKEA